AFGLPRRTAAGIDYNRLNLLIAVLEKRASLSLGEYDVYVNLTGGLKLSEPSLDLALISAVVSGFYDIPVPPHVICFGEAGLTGEIRGVSQANTRVKEAVKLGFTKILLPAVSLKDVEVELKPLCVPVRHVREAVKFITTGK
ncbi:MAG: DNA repair protein RadA, partial [Lachnospiraceae bacterium]|nr:DNA repair protein RadA [Lachnospiraceae bacterium]